MYVKFLNCANGSEKEERSFGGTDAENNCESLYEQFAQNNRESGGCVQSVPSEARKKVPISITEQVCKMSAYFVPIPVLP